ncbi:MAG: glycosyltransferase family 39 protein [Candidatus Shapirobacteria bacterium]|jgi:4-amino-4-deoxy-L-arabinose transferase-like glycosyltransferase
MSNKHFVLFLILISVFGFYLRTKNIATNPPHLGNDEISIAFDSYSIRTVGKDEHGRSWPLSFMSHRSYKAPLYAYLNTPFNYIFGNNEYGIRMLSAISGTLLILIIGLLGKTSSNTSIGILSAIIIAITPKAIMASRIGYEANLALTIMSFGVLAMIYYRFAKKTIWLIVAGVFLGLSVWGYHTQWGLAPMLAFCLPMLFRPKIKFTKWWPTWILLVVIVFPIYLDFYQTQLSDSHNRASSQIWYQDGQLNDYLKNSPDNKVKKIAVLLISPINNYIEHFSFDTLFGDGLGMFERTSPLEFGWFLLPCLPLLIVGLIKVNTIFGDNKNWLLLWMALSPIIPATTYGGVAAVRNLSIMVPLSIITAGGWWYLKKHKPIIFLLTSSLLLLHLLIFLPTIFVHFQKSSGNYFQFGYKQSWEKIKPVVKNYQHVIVESRFGRFGQFVGVPHLYFGYFGAFPVEAMQSKTNENGRMKIDKFEFGHVDWMVEEIQPKSIYVVSTINPIVANAIGKLNQIEEIITPDNQSQFLIYATK